MKYLLFSVHTVEFIQGITFNEYSVIVKKTRGGYKKITSKGKDYHSYFKDQGLRMVIHYRKNKPIILRLIINLNAICGGDANTLFNQKFNDIYNIFPIIDSIFIDMNLHLRISDFVIGRVDFTTDIQMHSDEEVMDYIALAKKKGLDQNYKNKYRPGMKGIHYENSFDISCKSVEFTAYNKYRQLIDINYLQEEASLKYGVLRVEVKLGVHALSSKSKGVSGNYEGNKLNNINYIAELLDHSKDVIKYYAKKFFTPGTYYKYTVVINKIKRLNIKEKYKEIACVLIKEASKNHSLRLAEDILIERNFATKRQIKKVEDIFKENDINPITLGERSGFTELPSLLSFIDEEK